MKTFSTQMEICRQGRGHDIAWLVEVDWDEAVGRYASRPVSIGGIDYEPIVAGIEGLRLAMPPVTAGSTADSPTVRIEMVNVSESGEERFEAQTGGQPLEGRTVRVGFVFLDPAISLQTADIIWLQTYQVERAVLGTAKAVLRLGESVALAGRRRVGRRLLPGLDPRLSTAAVGRVIPLIFGRVEHCPLIPFRVGRRGYLRSALRPDDTTVAVEDASIFPDFGRVQVEDEVITYAAVDRSGRTLGRADSPVVRTAPAHHRAGEAVDWIPDDGFEYLVADHRCRLVGPIYSGNRLIASSNYESATERLDGREVQKVVFPTLPVEVSYGATTKVSRIDEDEDENQWGIGSGNNAANPLAAVVGLDPTNAAVLGASQTPLEIEYLGDLAAGQSTHGEMVRCRLSVEYSASQRWSVTNEIRVTVGRGQNSAEFLLGRPPVSESLTTFPAHSHGDTIRDRVADTRELFEIAQQSRVVSLDLAQAESGWPDREQAIAGNLESWCENTPVGGPRELSPLTARLLREPLAGQSVALEAIEFHARMATDESSPVTAALDVNVAGKFVDSMTVNLGTTPQTHQYVLETSALTVEDLVDPATAFSVRSVDGRQVKLYGVWLQVRYRPKIAGRDQPASQSRTGSVAASAPVPVPLPAGHYRQAFDLTDLAQSNGDWAFFSPQGSDRPFVKIEFGSTTDPTIVRIAAIAIEVEYRPRESVAVFDRFSATVEGVEDSGTLVENPADIIEWLVTNEAGLGWDHSTIDSDSFDQARAWLAARDWRLSRRIGVQRTVETLLDEIARESGCRLLWEAGRLRLLPQPAVLLASEAAATLDSSLILSAPPAKRGSPLGELVNVVRVRYGAGYSLGGGELRAGRARWIELADEGSAALPWGRREREFLAHWHASSPPDRVTRLAALLLSQSARPKRLVDVDLPISQSHLERGDIVIVDHPASRLDQAPAEVAAVEVIDGRWVRLSLAVQSFALYCWYGDAETFIAHLPGNTEKVFVVEGVFVAALDRTGRLRLRDEVIEKGLAAYSMTDEIEHDAVTHRLYFGVGDTGSGYAAVFALDNDGRLLLRGAAREESDLSSLPMSSCHEADPSRFLFSCDLATALLEYNDAADRMNLAGRIVENAPL